MAKQRIVKLPSSQYWRHLGLNADPFPVQISAEPYVTPRWQHYLNFLLNPEQYRKSLLLVVGPQGVGKTTLFQQVYQQLRYKREVLQIDARTGLGAEDISVLLASEFNAPPPSPNYDIYATIEHQINVLQATGRQYLLLIDDAEKLPLDAQQLCLHIIKFQAVTQTCLQIVLFGKPELIPQFEKIAQQQGDSFNGYIINTLPIEPFNREEVQQYLKDRLKMVGYDGRITLFAQVDVQQIYQESGGIPTKIPACARAMLQDLVTPQKTSHIRIPSQYKWWIGVAIIIALLLTVLLPWLQNHNVYEELIAKITTKKEAPVVSSVTPDVTTQNPPTPSYPPGSHIIINGEITKVDPATPQVDSLEQREKQLIDDQIHEIPNVTGQDSLTSPATPAAHDTPTHEMFTHETPAHEAPVHEMPAHDVIDPIDSPMAAEAPSIIENHHSGLLLPLELSGVEQRLLKISKSMHTLQLFLSSDPEKVQIFLNKHRIADVASVYRTVRQEQLVYIVILGYFPSQQEAMKTIPTLDPALQKLSPWPRTFSSVQADILKIQ